MNTLEICSPLRDFGTLAGVSAFLENRIDFLRDDAAACLCTTAFCANELKEYLQRTDPGLRCVFADEPSGNCTAVILECLSNARDDGGFSFVIPCQGRLVIRAASRNGLVNGTYELLRLQGWRWIEPGADGEFAPVPHTVVLPVEERSFKPSFAYRAFYFEYPSQESLDFLMWMIHNRMNVYGYFPTLNATAQKLGMYLLAGGHIITDMLKPGRLMPSGKTLLEEHPDWYGVRKDGEKVTAANAQNTQFCCTNPELMDFIADELVQRLNHEWRGTDILGVSGFDTWGSTCQCENCRRLSDSDKYMAFMSALRTRLDRACQSGKLSRNPMLNTSAYEGTATFEAPSRIPDNMAAARDNCVAFVINRCYRHPMGAEECTCPINARYGETVRQWGKFGKTMTLWAGEYYNVTRYEDLPLLFVKNMAESMRFYYDTGARGITYMHSPILNWSIRGITQGLHAALGWDVHTDADAFCREFLLLKYGEYADEAKAVCDDIEAASADIAEWRSWGDSILRRFEHYAATGELGGDLPLYHYRDNADVIRGGKAITTRYRRAVRRINAILDAVYEETTPPAVEQVAVNPEELARKRTALRRMHFLECDLRALHYAIDVITLMTGCVQAYDILQKKTPGGLAKLLPKLEKQAKRMSLYTVSISFRIYTPHIETRSALERSQCGPFIRALRREL